MRSSFVPGGDSGLAPWTGDLAWLHRRCFDRAAAVRCCRLIARQRNPVVLVGVQRLGRQGAEVFYGVEAAAAIVFDLFEMKGSGDRRRRVLEHWACLLRESDFSDLHPVTVAWREFAHRRRLSELFAGMAEAAGTLCRGADPPSWEALQERSRRLVAPYAEALRLAMGREGEGPVEGLVDFLAGQFLCERWCRLSQELAEERRWLPLSWCDWLGVGAPDHLDHASAGILVRLAVEGTRGLFRRSLAALLDFAGPWRKNLLARWLAGRARLHQVDELGADVLLRPPPQGLVYLGRSAVGAGLDRLGDWLKWN